MQGQPDHEVFIAYAGKGLRFAEQLHDGLARNGVSAFLAPRDIKPGVEWLRKMVTALLGTQVFVPIITKETSSSRWQTEEIVAAHDKVIPTLSVWVGRPRLDRVLGHILGQKQRACRDVNADPNWVATVCGAITDRLPPRIRQQSPRSALLRQHSPAAPVDVVIPVGPLKWDRVKMSSTQGIKLLAMVPGKGNNHVSVLEKIVSALDKGVRDRIGRILLLTTLAKNDEWSTKLDQCVAHVARAYPLGARIEILRRRPEDGVLTGGYSTLYRTLSKWFLLHYADVWPENPSLYATLLNRPEPRHLKGLRYGGALASAAKLPRGFLHETARTKGILEAAASPVLAQSVAKPFHRMRARVINAGHEPSFVHLTNMAIALISRAVLASIHTRNANSGAAGGPHAAQVGAVRDQEFFNLVTGELGKEFYFHVDPYYDDWSHADDDEDVATLNDL